MTKSSPHPSFGPVSGEMMAKAVAAPAGGAVKIIREVVPTFNLKDGDKIKWCVTFARVIRETAEYIVEAESEKEAEEIADEVPDHLLIFEFDRTEDCMTIDSIEPMRGSA